MDNTSKFVYLPQLQRYDEKIKGWADGKFLLKTQAYSLPKATTTALGGVKIGTGLNVATDGTASVNETYVDSRVTAVGDKKYALKADVAEVKAKLYPAAENILVGSETGSVVHVEDAFAGASLREITVEGAAKQDGIPSPDAPKAITVIEHPTVKVMGKNLLDIHEGMPLSDCNKSFDSSEKRIIKPGTYVVGLTFNNYLAPSNLSELKIAEGSIGFDTTDQGYGVGVGVNLVNGATYIDSVADYHSFYDEDGTFLRYVYGHQFQVPDDAAYSVAVFRSGADGHFRASNIAITHVADNGAYAPHTSQTLTFNLPAEHPYLAKLPDGTADEIMVDREGNVELVARVMQMKVPDDGLEWTIQEQPSGLSLGYTDRILGFGDIKKNLDAAALMSDRLESQRNWKNNPCFGISAVLWVVPRTNQGDITPEDVAAVANGMVFYAPLATSVTYHVGKIEMPKAQDSIVNAWTNAEVTPRTGIEYTRDVNIVVTNLESAIASITQG